jgi:spermidine synthase
MGNHCAARPALLSAAVFTLASAAAAAAPAKPAAPAPAQSSCTTLNLLAGKKPHLAADIKGDVSLVTDGAVAQEGAQWDAPAAVTFEVPSAGLTYDLGETRSVSALFVQADANDTYRITGSADGTPGSFRLVADVPNVVDRGHGLRDRAIHIAPTIVRYLRFGDGNGDGFFSLSEFSAYCQRPTPFPPTMLTVQAPPAQTGGDGSPSGKFDAPVPTDGGRPVLLMVAAGLALFWIIQRAVTRVTARPTAAEPPPAEAGDGAAAGTAEAAAAPVARRGLALHDLLRILFVASGCAALIYEVVWFHLLRLVIGASALSVGIVLASFMGGMFLGSLLFARYVPRDKDPVRMYAYLEIGIGVFGLLMPILLPAVRFVYIGLVGYGPLGIALRAIIAAFLLLPPTALMGATLPAIARRYPHGRRGMSALGGLYAANTMGAVLGCLLSAFVLLALFDVWVATIAAAALNFVIGGLALRATRNTVSATPDVPAPPPPAAVMLPRDFRPIYVAAGLSGLTALGAQVVWTRLLTLLFGATVYAFAIILAVFLAGLGIGSAIASYQLRRGQNPARGLAWTQIALVPSLLLGGFLLANALPYASPPAWTPVDALHALHVVRAVIVILPGALFWGMSFPFALAAAAAGGGDTGRSSGYVYAANTVGAIIGALVISFWIIPAFGTLWAQRTLVIAAALSAAVPLLWLRRQQALAPAGSPSRPVVSPVLPLAIGALAAALVPGLSTMFKTHGRYIWWVDSGDKYPYVAEGAASTVGVHIAPNGYSNFHVSGRVEATNNPNDLRTERLIGHLSGLLHPKPESVLVVGLGAGITAGALTLYPEVKRIVICEIEPRVVGAANQFAKENYAALSNPKVQIVFDDARHFLATTREKFDIITSDPIHPWVRGNSILFSREYYAIVKAHLKPGGLASQWVPLYETSEQAIKIQMKTFMDAFPDGTVWNTMAGGKGYDVVLVGGNEPLRLDAAAIQGRMNATPALGQSLRDVKINGAVDLLATYGSNGRDMTKWLTGSPVNRDFSLKLEYISGLALNNKEADTIYTNMTAGRSYPMQMITAPPEMHAELIRRIGGKMTQ